MPAPRGLHMRAGVHALGLSQHALHAVQVLLYLFLPVYHMLGALHVGVSIGTAGNVWDRQCALTGWEAAWI